MYDLVHTLVLSLLNITHKEVTYGIHIQCEIGKCYGEVWSLMFQEIVANRSDSKKIFSEIAIVVAIIHQEKTHLKDKIKDIWHSPLK